MQLHAADFNEFLTDIGQTIAWRKGYACPCIMDHSGSPNPDCLHCTGRGRIWRAAVSGYAGVSSMATNRKFANFGVFTDGDLLLTLPSDSPLYEMGQYDLVLAVNASEPFSSILHKGRIDRLTFPPISISRVFWYDEDGQLVESGARGITTAQEIDWGNEVTPPSGTQYSVTGRWVPDYYVYLELPKDRAHHFGHTLPRRVVVRRFDLYGR